MSFDPDSPDWTYRSRREQLLRATGLIVVVIAVFWSYDGIDLNITFLKTAHIQALDMLRRAWPPDITYFFEILSPLLMTVHIALLGTVLAAVLSIPVALLAAENITPNRATMLLGQLITTVSRSVSSIIWALIFVIMFGSGPLAGVLALSVKSIGFIGRMLREGIEEIDPTSVEAIAATGASKWLTILYGIVPQIKPVFIGVSIYELEGNVRGATVLGFVGAGGIGVQLKTSINFLAWDQAMTIIIAILGLVVVGEYVSAKLRALAQ
jgi:phosphonate transport system permease protein